LWGADGAASVTRKLTGIGTTRDQYRQQAMVINVRHEPPQQTMTWQMFTPDGPRAYLPLPDAAGSSWGHWSGTTSRRTWMISWRWTSRV